MSVNLSGRQLDDPGLADSSTPRSTRTQLPPTALKLEITESTLMPSPSAPATCSPRSARGGVGLHLDDFGTGYSSLSALHRFPSTR